MEYLFNSKGKHIATFSNGLLYNSIGRNIGCYLNNEKIFIDLQGRYLGEIINTNRLAYCVNSCYDNSNFGNQANYGMGPTYSTQNDVSAIENMHGYEDLIIL